MIRLWTPFWRAKVQGDQSTRLRGIAILQVCKNTKKKKKKKRIETLAALISEMA